MSEQASPAPDGRSALELLADSEVSLRMVERVLRDAGIEPSDPAETRIVQTLGRLSDDGADPESLPGIMSSIVAEVVRILDRLRTSRHAVQEAALDRLQHGHHKLREVSSTTEAAATDMLDAIERALGIVDRLEDDDAAADRPALHGALRDELYTLMSCMQFQDITSQQLAGVLDCLSGAEERLGALLRSLAPPDIETTASEAGPRPYDPDATLAWTKDRQNLVDEVFNDD